jgi:hypothetical protein
MNRRDIISATAVVPLVSAFDGSLLVNAASSASEDFSAVKGFHDFGSRVIGRADLSRAACEVAVNKVARADAMEFAKLELFEANTVLQVLKEMGIALPAMDAGTKAALANITDAPQGGAFDKAFMAAEHDNHIYLRDLASAYLTNSSKASTLDEKHGRHIAGLALFAFTEHVVITERINAALSA